MIVETIILGLIAYRLWRIVAVDSITQPLRDRMPEGLLEFVTCPWCLGWWITLLAAAAWHMLWGMENPFLSAVAASVITGFIGEHA